MGFATEPNQNPNESAATGTPAPADAADVLVLELHRTELALRKRYETISIVNDLLIGTWFLVGSLFFLSSSLAYAGTWLFVIGSIEMLIRPTIRFVRRLHLARFHPHLPGAEGSAQDF